MRFKLGSQRIGVLVSQKAQDRGQPQTWIATGLFVRGSIFGAKLDLQPHACTAFGLSATMNAALASSSTYSTRLPRNHSQLSRSTRIFEAPNESTLERRKERTQKQNKQRPRYGSSRTAVVRWPVLDCWVLYFLTHPLHFLDCLLLPC
jgi:hypothetical protein